MKKINFNLIDKKTIYVIIAIALLFLAGLNFLSFFFIQNLRQDLTTQLEQQITHLGKMSAKLVESYAPDLDKIVPGMENSPGVRIYQQLLFEIKSENDLENTLILDLLGRLLIDSRINYKIGDSLSTFPLNREKFQVASTGEIPQPIFLQVADQYFMTAYVPLFNEFQEPVAVLVIDAPMKFFSNLRRFELGTLYFGAGGLGILLLFSLLIIVATNRLFRAETRVKEQEHLAQLGQMAASVAHEIRNPLSIMKGTAEVLKKKYADTGEEMFSFIPEEINRLNRLVEDFLQFTRNKKLDVNPSDLGKLISDTIQRIQNPRIALRIQPNLPLAKIDPDSVRQVLLNIVYNALDATNSGGKVEVEVGVFYRSTHTLQLLVRDEGNGIPPQNLGKIFQPFFSTKASGSGLGLAISKQLIEQQQGKISVTSKVGKGTTVEILLPIAK